MSFSDVFGGWEREEDIKERFGEGIEMFFNFREEDREVIEDLRFGFRDLMFNLRDLSCEDFKITWDRRGFKEFGVFKSKESDDESVFFIGFRGIRVVNVGGEFRYSFRINYEDRGVMFQEEVSKRDMVSTRGFNNNGIRGEGLNDVNEVFKIFRGLVKRTLFKDISGLINYAIVKRVFGYINTGVKHSCNLPLLHSPGLQGLLSPTNLLGLEEGQRGRLLKRLLSLYEMGSLSLCILILVFIGFWFIITINIIP